MPSKVFLNLNRFKSGKAIKQQTKRRAGNNRNEPVKKIATATVAKIQNLGR
jgi:hypothetical protein